MAKNVPSTTGLTPAQESTLRARKARDKTATNTRTAQKREERKKKEAEDRFWTENRRSIDAQAQEIYVGYRRAIKNAERRGVFKIEVDRWTKHCVHGVRETAETPQERVKKEATEMARARLEKDGYTLRPDSKYGAKYPAQGSDTG